MDERDRGWQVETELARSRRLLARATRRTKRRLAAIAVPGLVAASDARRRKLHGAYGVSAAWAIVVLVDVILIRAHVLKDTYTGISTLTGAIAGPLLLGIHYGWAGRPSLTVRNGQHMVSARTLTGVRTLNLDDLVSVRRFETIQRTGGYLDEFHLHDRHGVRLAVDNERPINAALRGAVPSPDSRPGHDGLATVQVTRHARSALGMARRSRFPGAMHRFWGFWMMMAAMGAPALLSYMTACVLAGTDVLGRPGH